MVSYTPTYGLPAPSLGEAPNVPADIAALADGTESALLALAMLPVDNLLINGGFGINQRAASSYTRTSTQTGYTVDRWILTSGTGATNIVTPTAIATGSFAGAPRWKLAWNRSVAGSANSYLEQRIEDVRTAAGKNITVSLNAAVASGTADITISVVQNFGTGGSPSSETSPVVSSTITVDTSVSTRRVATLAVPSISGKTIGSGENSYLSIRINRASGAGTGTIDLWDAGAVIGAVDRPFLPRSPAAELMRGQRYYYQLGPYGASRMMAPIGMAVATTIGRFTLPIPPMRDTPTVTFSSGTDFRINGGSDTSAAVQGSGSTPGMVVLDFTGAGLTLGNACFITNDQDTTNAAIYVSAEL